MIFLHLIAAIEYDPGVIIALVLGVVIGVPIITCAFFIIRRLHELHTVHNKIEGELYVSEAGDMYAEYLIPISDIVTRDYILLKVNTIKEGKNHE